VVPVNTLRPVLRRTASGLASVVVTILAALVIAALVAGALVWFAFRWVVAPACFWALLIVVGAPLVGFHVALTPALVAASLVVFAFRLLQMALSLA